MFHAGVLPSWTSTKTLALASEVESVLRSPELPAFLHQMYSNTPARWDDALAGTDRLRVIVNALTRMRYCTTEGEMEFDFKEGLDKAPAGYMPWFDVPGRATAGQPSTRSTDGKRWRTAAGWAGPAAGVCINATPWRRRAQAAGGVVVAVGKASSRCRMAGKAASARARNSSSLRSWIGCATNTIAGSIPSDLACMAAACTNSVDAIPTPGRPRDSRSAMSCIQHDVQDPQSARPSMTSWLSAAICWRSAVGAGRVKVGFL